MSHTDKKTLNQLKKQIQKHDYHYYVLDSPIISDYEYDRLFKKLQKMEEKHPQWLDKNSPTQRVSGKPLSAFQKASHYKAMLSLENTYSVEECVEFIKKVKKTLEKDDVTFFCEPKLDGVAVNLIYEKGHLTKALTRGDGVTGEDVLENIKTIKSVPLELNMTIPPPLLEVRAEVVLFKKDFLQLNKEQKKDSEKLYSNPRNVAAGTLRNLDAKVTSTRKLRLFCHSPGMIQAELIQSQSDFFSWLKEMYFPVFTYSPTVSTKLKQKTSYLKKPLCLLTHKESEIISYYHVLQEIRDLLPFETDGIVVKINSFKKQTHLGVTGRSPRWAVAVKFPPVLSVTKINSISLQLGRTGVVTPVAQMEEVLIDNVKVSQATLHNMNEVKKKDIRIGDFVRVQRAGDVIPEVVDVVLSKRPKNTTLFKVPKKCPVCSSSLEVIDEGLYCTSMKCPAVLLRKLQHFCSKKAMNIEELGDKMIERLFLKKWIQTFSDIYLLQKERLKTLDRMADQSSQNVIRNIERSKKTTFDRFLFSLGIRHVGRITAIKLGEFFGENRSGFQKLMNASQEELIQVEDVGEIVAQSLAEGLAKLTPEIHLLFQRGIQLTPRKKQSQKLQGMTFVITGRFEQPRKKIEQMIVSHGGHFSSSISSKTHYLLCGVDPGSKQGKAKKLKIPCLNWKQFEKKLS